ncbi:TerC family protein [Candidatus Erwinia haradaeae]|uniref:UPF0053 inner membrane protein YgdQ n=1 Tax=Candidatus Erwinia haradaeae TaxID=1922217 RepID=A0A451D1R6_9GAMM|nr:TerC family protein [Candidatus Erwinia haradaeae]VFP79569.1 Putative UPF0053 inner membrane protein YgdQ [Candidatus Erwinia haradaeae]
MHEWITTPNTWLSLGTLIILEIILGIDNIIFLMLVVEKLPEDRQYSARILGMAATMIMRLILLIFIAWIMHYTDQLLTIVNHNLSIRDLILLCGGIFLCFSSNIELYRSIQGTSCSKKPNTYHFFGTIIQIILLDIIFSLDSIITAIGLSDNLVIIMTAVIISVPIMMFFSSIISNFMKNNPSIKILALSSLFLIGVTLILESFGINITKNYIYFAIFFSGFVESLNIKRNKQNTS